MYCFEGMEFKLEDNQEMGLFSNTEIMDEKDLLEQTRDAESTLDNLFENTNGIDLSELLSTTFESQTLNDFLQSANVEESPSVSPALSSWNKLFSYPDSGGDGNDVESDCTDCDLESTNGGEEVGSYTSHCLDLTDDQLLNMTAKELNRLKGLSKKDITSIKKRRRVLLNRCYARKSRVKRLDAQTNANQEKEVLVRERDEVKEELEVMRLDRDKYKQKYNSLKEIIDSAISEKAARNTLYSR